MNNEIKIKGEQFTVGVILGRFQIDLLHHEHLRLIESVLAEHDKVFLYLGLSAVKSTINNPLDFQPRKQMIMETFPHDKYPNLSIYYIKDQRDDAEWSKNLDRNIEDNLSVNDTVVLYGGRSSFLDSYSGKFKTRELIPDKIISATEIRQRISSSPKSHPLFRAGIIYGTFQKYPTCFPTVDVAIVDTARRIVLLGKKSGEKLFRFIGGFASPNSDCFELDAIREVKEETDLNIDNPLYLGSFKIKDWRYFKEVDKIKTLFFFAKYKFGQPIAGDDISEIKWFKYEELIENNIMEEHHLLLAKLNEYIVKMNY